MLTTNTKLFDIDIMFSFMQKQPPWKYYGNVYVCMIYT